MGRRVRHERPTVFSQEAMRPERMLQRTWTLSAPPLATCPCRSERPRQDRLANWKPNRLRTLGRTAPVSRPRLRSTGAAPPRRGRRRPWGGPMRACAVRMRVRACVRACRSPVVLARVRPVAFALHESTTLGGPLCSKRFARPPLQLALQPLKCHSRRREAHGGQAAPRCRNASELRVGVLACVHACRYFEPGDVRASNRSLLDSSTVLSTIETFASANHRDASQALATRRVRVILADGPMHELLQL